MARGAGVGVDITMLNDKRLARKLRKLRGAEQKKIVRQHIRKAVKVIQADAVSMAPRDEGKMRKLKIRAIKRTRKMIGVMLRTPTAQELGVADNRKGFYPAVQHYGNAARGITGIPFLTAPLKKNKEKTLTMIKQGISEGIRKVARSK